MAGSLGDPTASPPPPPPRRVVAGADAFGSALKEALVRYLRDDKGVEVVDLGVDAYYAVAVKVASQLAAEKRQPAVEGGHRAPLSRGLLVCGTGVGVSIFANKFGGVYAAPCNSVDEAVNARSINNTNVLTLGAKIASPEEGKKILDAWLDTPFKAPCPASDGQPWSDEIEQFLDGSVQEMERISGAGPPEAPPAADGGVHDKSTSTMDAGGADHTSDAAAPSPIDLLQKILKSSTLAATAPPNAELEKETRAGVGPGLTRVHATASAGGPGERAGVGPGLTAIHAPVSQLSTVSLVAVADFESPIAEEGDSQQKLENIKPQVAAEEAEPREKPEEKETKADESAAAKGGCAICALASTREFESVGPMPGGSWRVVRDDPTSAVVRFDAGSVEPAHHHTFGHDVIVTRGKKTVWNLSTGERFELAMGDFLYTPAGDVHRVHYHEDTEFFIRWDGHWDILLDEDLDTAKAAFAAGSKPPQ